MTSPTTTEPPLRDNVAVITAAAVRELQPVWKLPPPDLINALFDVLPTLVNKWSLASASAAADWYDELRDVNGVKGRFQAIVQPLEDLGSDALAGWGSEPLAASKIEEAKAASQSTQPRPHQAKVDQASKTQSEHQDVVDLDKPSGVPSETDLVDTSRFRVEGGLQKRIVNAANLTVTDSAEQDPQARGWMRRTRPEACKFCIMVASRGGVFTKASSTFACHERCFCEAVPAWGGQALPVGPYKPSDKPSTAADRARVRKWIRDNL